jgi:cytochrome c oxidase subunit 3
MNRNQLQNNLAMTVTLIMGSMLFATLFLGYAVYRSSAIMWPPLGIQKVSLLLPFLSTLVILASSWFMYQGRLNLEKGNLTKSMEDVNLTLGLGGIFMVLQCYLWFYLKSTGIFLTTSGIFGSILYGFTWIHAFHMIFGILSLVYLRFAIKRNNSNILQTTVNVEKFWHFLGVVWIVMFLTIFVL